MRLEFVNKELTTVTDVDSLINVLTKYKSMYENALELLAGGSDETIYVSNNRDSIDIKSIDLMNEEQLILLLKHTKDTNEKMYQYILHRLHELNFGPSISNVKVSDKPKYKNTFTNPTKTFDDHFVDKKENSKDNNSFVNITTKPEGDVWLMFG